MKFTTAAAATALFGAAAAKDSRTFAVMHFTNKQLTIGSMDPIVTPGRRGTHSHHVLGGSNFGLSSTGQDLLKSNCSTARVAGDDSNYWFPSLYFKDPKTGLLESVEIFYSNVYYFFEATDDDIKPFPVGLQMFSGDPTARTPPAGGANSNLDPSNGPVNPIKWTCPRSDMNKPGWPVGSDGSMSGMQDPNNKGEGVGFPDVTCDGYASPLRGDIHFPSCYNPEAGLTDYKNNMAFPTNKNGKANCPPGWIHTPHIFYETYWNTPPFAGRWVEGQGDQPFVLSNGDATGYGNHADFMSGWDEKLLQYIIDTCNVGSSGMENCSGLFYGLNTKECTIADLIDEQVIGTMSKLSGNNPITGWKYGKGDGSPQPSQSQSSSAAPSSTQTQSSTAAPTSTKGQSSSAPASSAPASSSAPAASSTTNASQSSVPTTKATVAPTSSDYGYPSSSAPAGSSASSSAPMPTASSSTGGQCEPIKTSTTTKIVTITGTAPSSPSSTGAVVEGFKYVGCYKDNEARTLNGKIRPDIGRMSNEKCIVECKRLGFSVAGTEYAGQCYCGNDLVGSEILPESACSMACEDSANTMCGGSWALSVYSQSGDVTLKDAPRRRQAHASRHAARHAGRR